MKKKFDMEVTGKQQRHDQKMNLSDPNLSGVYEKAVDRAVCTPDRCGDSKHYNQTGKERRGSVDW
jgi:hypothetical protein